MQKQSKGRLIQDIKERTLLKKRRIKVEEDTLAIIHHALMINYGWIPLNEFKSMPIPTVLNLLDKLAEMQDEINRKMKKH